MKKATDLKHQFDRHTAWILGGAVAGGFLLSRALHKPPTFAVMPGTDTDSAERINPKKISRGPGTWSASMKRLTTY